MNKQTERRLLQLAVAVACLVPLAAGSAGVVQGLPMLKGNLVGDLSDVGSHFAYLSGLLVGVGVVFAASIPCIERRSELFLALSCVVFVGGLARLSHLLIHDWPRLPHILALAMELAVVPLLLAWQRRVAFQFRS